LFLNGYIVARVIKLKKSLMMAEIAVKYTGKIVAIDQGVFGGLADDFKSI
jgi:hypothetical protein